MSDKAKIEEAKREAARIEFHERRKLETNEHDFAFLDGYDAAATRWQSIADGLPTEEGEYLFRRIVAEGRPRFIARIFTAADIERGTNHAFTDYYSHYQKIESPEGETK